MDNNNNFAFDFSDFSPPPCSSWKKGWFFSPLTVFISTHLFFSFNLILLSKNAFSVAFGMTLPFLSDTYKQWNTSKCWSKDYTEAILSFSSNGASAKTCCIHCESHQGLLMSHCVLKEESHFLEVDFNHYLLSLCSKGNNWQANSNNLEKIHFKKIIN